MSDFRIFESTEFQKAFARLEETSQHRLRVKLREYVYPQLRAQPHFGLNIKRLRDYAPPTWRYRIGNYRLFYSVSDSERMVSILTLDDRKDAYK